MKQWNGNPERKQDISLTGIIKIGTNLETPLNLPQQIISFYQFHDNR